MLRLVLVLLLASAPFGANARPGLSGSLGSRGSRTYAAPPATATNPYGASQFGRSLTPRGGYAPYGAAPHGGVAQRGHPLLTGIAGGLLGVGLGSLLLGHGLFGGGLGGGGLLWLLIEIALVVVLLRWLFRRFAGGGRPSMQGGMPGAGAAALAIGNADYRQFEQGLLDVQQAWSMRDMRSLSRFATPEMASYFSDQLADLAGRNLRNVVSAVRMEQGDLSEAWREGDRDFATVAMRYSTIDVTTDLTGRVVDGSPNERQMVVELWTFVRPRGGSWLLSAIQQGR